MPLVHMSDMLNHAHRHGYAVGAFDVASLDFLEGILCAAEHCRAPVIFSLGNHQGEYGDFDLLMAATIAAARRTDLPVAISLDYGTDITSVTHAIAYRCNAVMLNTSALPFDENLRKTREVVELAHAHDIAVVGVLGEPLAATQEPGTAGYTSPAEAKAYVERSKVDCLAVSVGSGAAQKNGHPKLDYTRLAKINEAVDVPLVVHDGTGLSDDQFRRLILNGVAKINYCAGLAYAAARVLRDHSRDKQLFDYSSLLSGVRNVVRSEAEYHIHLWGGSGRAAEVLAQCRPWNSVAVAGECVENALN